jgi:PAS domain S-box-containing protein
MKWISGVLIGVGGTLGRAMLLTVRWLRDSLHNAAPEATTQPPDAHDTRFRSVWETAMDAMVVTDAAGIIQSANPAYYRLYGYEPPEMIGQHFTMVVPQERREQVWASYQQVFTGPDEVEPVETVVRRADGSERIVEARFGFLTERGQHTVLRTLTHGNTA